MKAEAGGQMKAEAGGGHVKAEVGGQIKDSVVVLGASGEVGRGIVAELLAAGYAVVAVARNKERLAALARYATVHRRLTVLPGSVATDAAGAALAQGLRDLPGRPAAVVASVCGPSGSGRLLERPESFLQRRLEEDVVSHFHCRKASAADRG